LSSIDAHFPPLSTSTAPGKSRWSLLHKGAHPFGVIGIKACLALEFTLEVELRVEIVLPGLIERTLDQRETRGRGGGEAGAELVCFLHQRGVVIDLPDQAPGFRGLGRQ